ncbi:OmpP1/FadL family transporter [Nevskia soli]|uniref:OmpP1/FadL family transporter n=1 Tax=Nevskia soli TaxID=418856 RepID=UPI0004A6E626|nr:outer membrane protein transport protein [Nevskia soli]
MLNRRYAAGVLALLGAAALPAQATNGYFMHGYGTASKAMGGVGYALPQDSLVVASNPAGLTLVGDRYDLGVDWFTPRRSSEIQGNTSIAVLLSGRSANGEYDGNAIKNFYIPGFGYSRQISQRFSAGIAMYGNGGLNTDYSNNPFAAFQLSGTPRNAGVNLEQLFITPSVAFRITDRQSIGVSVDVAYQMFKAYGLQAFAMTGFPGPPPLNVVGPFSISPGNVTDKGYARSWGVGYRIGYLAEPVDGLTIGGSWQPKIHMQRFRQYEGLFAGHGSFDVPANFGGGIAYRWRKTIVVSADVQRIIYSSVASVGDSLQPFVDGVKLGADGGPGFGWRNMTVYKFGAGYRPWKPLELMAGYSYGKQPVPQDQTLFNVLAPGVITRHYTVGASLSLGRGYEANVYYMRAPESRVYGQGSIPNNGLLPPGSFGGGEANIRLKEQAIGASLAVRF